jgi:N-acyl-D-aspartate/D-glutamate deacylase
MLTRVSLSLILTTMLLFSIVSTSAPASAAQYDLLIRNGLVIDGSGRPAYRADIAIKGDRIVQIGKLKSAGGVREIDATGLVAAPGFIDMLGQSETYMLVDPRAMSKVMMGVTTEVTGEGESIAPINDRLIKEQEDFNKRYNLTIDWRTLDEYFKRLEKQGRRQSCNLRRRHADTRIRDRFRQSPANRGRVGTDEATCRRRDEGRRTRRLYFPAIRSGAVREDK